MKDNKAKKKFTDVEEKRIEAEVAAYKKKKREVEIEYEITNRILEEEKKSRSVSFV